MPDSRSTSSWPIRSTPTTKRSARRCRPPGAASSRSWATASCSRSRRAAWIAGDKHHDVIGKTVNPAAMLDSTGVTLSVTAFRKLGPALRRRFKKHTPPVTYIRAEDPRRLRR
jgi:hypothetical protein